MLLRGLLCLCLQRRAQLLSFCHAVQLTLLVYLKIITGFSASLANLAADAVVHENVKLVINIRITCYEIAGT